MTRESTRHQVIETENINMILEASVYTLKKQAPEMRASHGYRILVMRYWPRGISWQDVDAWLPAAGPTPTFLLSWRRGGMSWNDFEHIYALEQLLLSSCTLYLPNKERQEHQVGPTDLLLDLEQQHGTVTILCLEPHAPCHRFTLKNVLEQQRHARITLQ